MARDTSAGLLVELASRPLEVGLAFDLVRRLALAWGPDSLGLVRFQDQLRMEVRVRDFYTLVNLSIDALLGGVLSSNGFVVPGLIQFLGDC